MKLKELISHHKINIIRLLTVGAIIVVWIVLSSIELAGSIPNSDLILQSLSLENIIGVTNHTPVRDDEEILGEDDYEIKIYDNEEMKELGRSTWKYFHYLLERFPDVSKTEKSDIKMRKKLVQLLELMGETYPCLEARRNFFLDIIRSYPLPINLNKIVNVEWGCHIHNLVNKQLQKEAYDCARLVEYEELNKVTFEKEEKQQG